jgi:hypothetical protein
MNMAVNTATELIDSPAPEAKNKAVIATATRLNDSDSFELISGDAVITLLCNDSGFQQSWDLLFDSCPWATVFQNRAFTTAWYITYRHEHCPVLIKHIEKGQLTGILAMAILDTPASKSHTITKGGRITAAGHYEGLYQTWQPLPTAMHS